jgi:translation initiation factor IF-3
MTAY